MKILKVKNYSEIVGIQDCLMDDFIVDLEDCTPQIKRRIIDFLLGFVYSSGSIVKQNRSQFVVRKLSTRERVV